MSEILVEAKFIGKKKPLAPQWGIPVPGEWHDGHKPVKLRDLIAKVVSSEFTAFKSRQEEMKYLRILTESEIQESLSAGRVRFGERDENNNYSLDQAVAIALQAFEDGLYFVFIEDQHYLDLDQTVHIVDDLHLTFVRLVALAGG